MTMIRTNMRRYSLPLMYLKVPSISGIGPLNLDDLISQALKILRPDLSDGLNEVLLELKVQAATPQRGDRENDASHPGMFARCRL